MLVIKIGGSIVPESQHLLREIADRDDIVLVHGFGPQTDEACQARGIEQRTVRSPEGMTSRFTDDAVLEAMQDAAAATQHQIVHALASAGAEPEPVGTQSPLFWAKAKPALRHQREDGRVLLVRGNRSGRVTDLAPEPVEDALAAGRVPVVTPLAVDAEGLVSVDADRAAAALAGRLDADALVLLTDVPGVLADPDDPTSRLEQLPAHEVDPLLGEVATGGMARKLVAAREATEHGVPRVVLADGRRANPIDAALAGAGTEVHP